MDAIQSSMIGIVGPIDRQVSCQELATSTREWWDKFNQKFGKSYPYPHLTFTLRGTVAGYAHYKKHLIEFNVELYLRHKEEFLKRTVPHEIAHLFAYQMYAYPYNRSIKPHGDEWSRVMTIMGLEPSRCHSYNTEGLGKAKPFAYKCSCHVFHVTKALHERIQKENGRRICLTCKQKLIYTTDPQVEATLKKEQEAAELRRIEERIEKMKRAVAAMG